MRAILFNDRDFRLFLVFRVHWMWRLYHAKTTRERELLCRTYPLAPYKKDQVLKQCLMDVVKRHIV
tara:strand:- start:87 stop:284 length:198 start_codon:yes stop_codon:yes gene_type:complete